MSLCIIRNVTVAPSQEPRMVATGRRASRGLRLLMSLFMSGLSPMPMPTKRSSPHKATKLTLLCMSHDGMLPLCPASSPRMKNPTTIKLPFMLEC